VSDEADSFISTAPRLEFAFAIGSHQVL